MRARHNFTGRQIKNYLEKGFFNKLRADIEKAKAQLHAYDATDQARFTVYMNPCFDDFLGENKEEYFRQVDEYFSVNPVAGIDVVVHNDRTPFHKDITLATATVVNEH